MDLVIGVDAGGTTTRCLVADHLGDVHGRGSAPGINQRSSGGTAPTHLQAAIRAALGATLTECVRGGVFAIAGAGEAGVDAARHDVEQVWAGLALAGRPTVVPDVLATFAAGTPEPTGTVLVAGTGAITAAVRDLEIVRRADGYGWLLGDLGSAVWLGREALTAVLAAMDGRAPATGLVQPVLGALSPTARTPQDVIATVYSHPPADLGRLAPVVTAQAALGDAVAVALVERGVAGVLASFDAVRREADGPCVLGGALLITPGPVADGVLRGLAERGVTDLRIAPDPSVGAAWLALRHLGRGDDRAVHDRLTGPPS